jgi:hypothetical protein
MNEQNEKVPQKNIDTQIPHSGVHGDERPVRDFDNTTLEQAMDLSLILPVPDTIRSIQSTGEIPVVQPAERGKKPERGHKGLLMIGGSLAGVALATAGVVTLANHNSSAVTPGQEQSSIAQGSEQQGQTAASTPNVIAPAPIETTQPSPSAIPGEHLPGDGTEVFTPTTSFEKMKAMTDINEFAKLSIIDRGAFTYTANPNLAVADLKTIFNPSEVPFYVQQLQIASYTSPNLLDGAKASSAHAYETSLNGVITPEYAAGANDILTNGGSNVMLSTTDVYVSNGTLQEYTTPGGEKVMGTAVVTQEYDGTGQKVGTEKTSIIVQTPIKLEDGRTIVVYSSMLDTAS